MSRLLTFAEDLAQGHYEIRRTEPAVNRRVERYLSELRRWADTHGGLAPRQSDWTPAVDPDKRWPRAKAVSLLFDTLAQERDLRYRVVCGCEPRVSQEGGCLYATCSVSGVWIQNGGWLANEPTPDLLHTVWVGPTGWAYALRLAGLDVRHARDNHAVNAQRIGRNRQMVTGGDLGAKRHGPNGGYA